MVAPSREKSSSDYTPSKPDDGRLRTPPPLSFSLETDGSVVSVATDIISPAPQPQTELARYRLLSPTAGVRVSPLCLGAMSLGDQWTNSLGGKAMDQAKSEDFLDAF